MGWKRGKRWNSCLMWFITSVGALCLTISCIGASDETQGENAWQGDSVNEPFSTSSASSNTNEVNSERLMLISTLDGKLSALDVQDEGKLLWSVQADTRALLSSSISKLEIMHDGVPTRYIPSLDGGLYRYDGESIEAVPMTAETLLSSSFRLADDTVMIGGKDLLTYGLDPQTGQIRYACGVKGCHTFGEVIGKEEDVIVLTRNTQTVRAVDARSGSEKWNFSVGQHDIQFMKGQRQRITDHSQCEDDDDGVITCPDEIEEEDIAVGMAQLSNSIKIVVPEGMVVGVNPDNMQTVTWQYKFKSPVSNAWLLYKGELMTVDMFNNQNIPALSSFEHEERPQHPPLLYVGMHQSQLYVQPSAEMQEQMEEAADRYNQARVPADVNNIPRVSWKPYLNTAQFRTPSMHNRPGIAHVSREERTEDDQECPDEGSALVIWHENYPFDNGFYLYPEFSIPLPYPNPDDPFETNQSQDFQSSILEDYLPVTLWNWWKEVMAISILTSVIVHLVLSHFKHPSIERQNSNNSQRTLSSSEGTIAAEGQDMNCVDEEGKTASRQNSDEAKSEYVSRYATDFEHMQTLGKGGFGIVFESRNKVDECHYAVKRIALPNSADAKEKVMREVKALAKLDHIGIVRYFHAWLESPPAGWQEERDKEIEDSECVSTPTPCNTVSQLGSLPFTSRTSHLNVSPSQSKYVFGSSPKPSGSPNARSPLDFLQNPFGGNVLDLSLSDAKRGGSEEFSVNNSNSNWDEEEEESGSFSCGIGTPNLFTAEDESLEVEFKLTDSEMDTTGSNVNNNCDSKPISIPFSCKQQNRVGRSKTGKGNQMEENSDSFQILFEDSGCGDKSSKGSSYADNLSGIQIQTSQSENWSESHDLLSTNQNSCSKAHTRSHSRTHSRNLSRDLAEVIYENEGDCDKNKQIKTTDQKPVESMNRKNSLPTARLYLFIQMQLCKRETLKDWLNANTLNRDRHMVLDMFDQIVSAIEYVHDCGLMHRDLKPSNIFFSLDGVIKMGDFGLATALPQEQNDVLYGSENCLYKKHTAQVGTQLYMSPEQTAGKVYSQKVDIFSLGVILFELLYPFATQMERVNTLVGVKVQKFPERFMREMPKENNFVKLLLSHCPEDRPTAKQVLESEFLKEFENRRMPKRFRTRTVSQNSS